jgi:hypothetical protein
VSNVPLHSGRKPEGPDSLPPRERTADTVRTEAARRVHSDSDITQVGQLRNLLALWNVVNFNYVHGQMRSVSPCGHWDDILNCQPVGK